MPPSASSASSVPAPQANASAESWRPLAGHGIGNVAAAWRDTLQSAGLSTLADFFSVRGEPLSKPGLGKRFRARLLVRHQDKEVPVYLKRFHGEKMGDWLKRAWEDGRPYSPAERELHAARALRAANINAPQPLAWGRAGRGPSAESFILLSAAEGEPFPAWWAKEGSKLSPREAGAWIRPLGETVRTLHAHGWRHRDLYLCHIFISRHSTGYNCALIDLQRVFRPRFRPERWRVKDLAQLDFSANAERIPSRARIGFLREYFQTARFSGRERTLIEKVVRKSALMTRRLAGASGLGIRRQPGP